MDDPRIIIRERALGILRDIPELRDSPMLKMPFSDSMLSPSDRWMVVIRSDSLAVGGFFDFFPSLSAAAPHVIGNAGKMIGMWNLFDGGDYGEKRMPLVSMEIDGGDHPVCGFSCFADEMPSSSIPLLAEVSPPDLDGRAYSLCGGVSVWSRECVDRFCVIWNEARSGRLMSFVSFHPHLRDAAIEICRHNGQEDGFHDLFSDGWGFSLDISIHGRIEMDGRIGGFHWSHANKTFGTRFYEEDL